MQFRDAAILACALAACGTHPSLLAAQEPGTSGEPARSSEPATRLVVSRAHTESVTSLAFARDGSLLLSGSDDGTARLWHVESGLLLRVLTGDSIGSDRVMLGPRGRRALTGGGGILGAWRLWDLATGRALVDFRSPLADPAFAADGSVLLLADGQLARIPGDGAVPPARWPVPGPALEDSPDRLWASYLAVGIEGRIVALASDEGEVRVLETADGRERARFQTGRGLRALAIGRGNRIATGHRDSETGEYRIEVRDMDAGAIVATLAHTPEDLTSLTFSPDGRFLLTSDWDLGPRLWDAGTGAELDWARPDEDGRAALTFSSDGQLVIDRPDLKSFVRDARSGAVLDTLRESDPRHGPHVFSPDGVTVASAGYGGSPVYVWPIDSPSSLRALGRGGLPVTGLSVDASGTRVLALVGSRRYARLPLIWNLDAGEITVPGHGRATGAVLLDSARVVVAERDVWIEDVRTGTRLDTLPAGAPPVPLFGDAVIAAGPSGDVILLADTAGAVLWGQGGETLRILERSWEVLGVRLTSEHVLLRGRDSVGVWDRTSGRQLHRFGRSLDEQGLPSPYDAWAVSPDGERLLMAADDGLTVRSVDSGAELGRHEMDETVAAIAFSPDGALAAVATTLYGRGPAIRLVSTGPTMAERHRIPLELEATGVAFAKGGRLLVAAMADGTVRLLELPTGRQLASVVAAGDGSWVAVTPDGRFDASDLRGLEGIALVAEDSPFDPLALDLFMRERYQPRLLAGLLNGDAGAAAQPLPPLPPRSPVRPRTDIAGVEVDSANASATVDVEVRETREGGEASGARDLQLFRNGRLVASRQGSLELSAEGSVSFRFDGIQLPFERFVSTDTFTAYAFNADGVRGPTARSEIRTPARSDAFAWDMESGRRAYVISLGVNDFSDPAWNLSFAANDARLLQSTVWGALTATAAFDTVVAVPLIADTDAADATTAEKEILRGVLALLAGRAIDPALRARIPNAGQLRRAAPRDLVVVSVSTHGYTAPDGAFYFLPEDIGPPGDVGRGFDGSLLGHAVSSEELADWLRAVDADLTLIIDACHSAAAVEGNGFKPGPFNSPGLGQLAYDKRMRVLAASQAADVALESGRIRQGLLTYALVEEGMRQGLADHRPADGEIDLTEWLDFGAGRVPSLHREIATGEEPAGGRGFEVDAPDGVDGEGFQRPALFDFSDRGDPVEMARVRDAGEIRVALAVNDVPPVDTLAEGLGEWLQSLVFLEGGEAFAAVSHEGETRLLDAVSGTELARSSGDGSVEEVIAVAGRPLVVTRRDIFDPFIRLEDPATGEALWSWDPDPAEAGATTAHALSPDGRWMAVGDDSGGVMVLDMNDGGIARRLPGREGGITALAFTGDGAALAIATADSAVVLVDHMSGTVRSEAKLDRPAASIRAASGCCRFLLLTGDWYRGATALIWDGDAPPAELPVLADGPVAVSADGRLAAVAQSYDGHFIHLVDLERMQPLARFVGPSDRVQALTFSPDGLRLVAGDGSGAVLVWSVAELLAR